MQIDGSSIRPSVSEYVIATGAATSTTANSHTEPAPQGAVSTPQGAVSTPVVSVQADVDPNGLEEGPRVSEETRNEASESDSRPLQPGTLPSMLTGSSSSTYDVQTGQEYVGSQDRSDEGPTSAGKTDTAADKGSRHGVCVICWTSASEVALIPCGHQCLCVDCSLEEKWDLRCPICRESVEDTVIIYAS